MELTGDSEYGPLCNFVISPFPPTSVNNDRTMIKKDDLNGNVTSHALKVVEALCTLCATLFGSAVEPLRLGEFFIYLFLCQPCVPRGWDTAQIR